MILNLATMDVALGRWNWRDPTESKPHKSTASEIENGHDPLSQISPHQPPRPLGRHCHSAEDADPTILQGAQNPVHRPSVDGTYR